MHFYVLLFYFYVAFIAYALRYYSYFFVRLLIFIFTCVSICKSTCECQLDINERNDDDDLFVC